MKNIRTIVASSIIVLTFAIGGILAIPLFVLLFIAMGIAPDSAKYIKE